MRNVRTPTFFEALLPILSMFLILTVGYGVYRFKIEAMLLVSATVAALIAWRVGLTWDEMIEGVSEKIAKAMPAILILVVVGIIVATWMSSGTIPMLIYYGIQIVDPRYFYVSAFVICAIISTCTGTSWGSIATIGVVLFVIAQGLGLPLPVSAAAIIGGSYFGDKMSPLSDTTNLAPLAAGAELYEHIYNMLYTTVPATLFALTVYWIMGKNVDATALTNIDKINEMLANLSEMFKMNVSLLLLPVIVILAGSVTRKPTIPVMMLSCVVAGTIAVLYQGFSFESVFRSVVSGFNADMIASSGRTVNGVLPEILKLVNRGGMNSMMETILMILCAFSFAGIIARAGCLDVILRTLLRYVKTRFALISSTAVATLLMALTTGSDFLTILIPGELFADAYRQRGLAPRNLSRTLEDCGTCVVALVPWSAAGAYCAGTLGISTLDYLPYCFFSFGSVCMAFICAVTGFGIVSLDKEKRNKKIREA